ncbi:MAG TPA: outer membrane beta-barrel protein [Flavobacterium sp.]|jgi:hypothetical protein
MSERKNIDRLFQEKFKDFEVEPSEHVWHGIEEKLREKKKRRVIPIWFRLAGVAAALLIGLLIFDPSADSNDFKGNSVVDANNVKANDSNVENDPLNKNNAVVTTGSSSEIKYTNSTSSDNNAANDTSSDQRIVGNDSDNTAGDAVSDVKNSAEKSSANRIKKSGSRNQNIANSDQNDGSSDVGSNRRNTAVASVNEEGSNQSRTESARVKESESVAQRNNINGTGDNGTTSGTPSTNVLIKDKESIAVITDDKTKIDTTAIATVVPNALEELLKEKEETKVTTNEPKVNRWQVSSNVAPIYFSSTSTGSALDSKFAENTKEIKSDLAYGLGVRYAFSKKFTVRAGVNSIGMEYSTNDVVFTQNPHARTLENVDPNIKGALLQFDNKDASTGIAPLADGAPRKFESSLNQRTGYIEVPVELSYKVIDKKFGIEVIGGVSTLFLSENSVTVVSPGLEMEIGKANNLNDTHFSTNIGLGLKYDFFKSFQINVEPMLKYQVNKFSDSSNYKPYFFGVYTGINYRF